VPELQPVRGVHDLLPEEMRRHRLVRETARLAAECFGYQEMETPIFEFSEVFKRTLGDTSDIVTKEMYTFTDRGGEQLTLRPEGTAGVARAFISGGLAQLLPLKYFYAGPMFRYERPQKGRLRQFHQVGVELLGVADPQGDIEVLALAVEFLRRLGIWERATLEINTLGDAESRQNYRQVLVDYLEGHKSSLSADSRDRLARNPLRILDSKDEGDQRIVAGAPLYTDYLNETSRTFYAAVESGLKTLGIPYLHNPRLVRGLDYYCHTCFEITCADLGAQKTVLAGGRYDGLIAMMGGPQTPGIGWASGIERCAMLAQGLPAPRRPIAVVPVGDAAQEAALGIACQLRGEGFMVELSFSGNVGKRLKRAAKLDASAAVMIGEDELRNGQATIRDLDSGAQSAAAFGQLATALAAYK